MSNWKWGRIFIFLLLGSIIFGYINSYFSNKVYADTTGWVDVAIDSKDTQNIIINLQKAKNGMSKWGATAGNAYILYGTPSTDLAEVNKNLDTYIIRAKQLQTLDKTSKEYQDGLTDLNNSLSNFYLYADDYWLRHNGIALFLTLEVLTWVTVYAFLAMIGYFFMNNKKKQPEVASR